MYTIAQISRYHAIIYTQIADNFWITSTRPNLTQQVRDECCSTKDKPTKKRGKVSLDWCKIGYPHLQDTQSYIVCQVYPLKSRQ